MSDFLLKRSGYRCSYCRERLTGQRWEREHIFPRSRGGADTLDNLVASCSRCNLNKGAHISYEDPVTGKTAPLFNPLKHRWEEHFHYSDDHVVGKTVIGRATAKLLFHTTNQQLPIDLHW